MSHKFAQPLIRPVGPPSSRERGEGKKASHQCTNPCPAFSNSNRLREFFPDPVPAPLARPILRPVPPAGTPVMTVVCGEEPVPLAGAANVAAEARGPPRSFHDTRRHSDGFRGRMSHAPGQETAGECRNSNVLPLGNGDGRKRRTGGRWVARKFHDERSNRRPSSHPTARRGSGRGSDRARPRRPIPLPSPPGPCPASWCRSRWRRGARAAAARGRRSCG